MKDLTKEWIKKSEGDVGTEEALEEDAKHALAIMERALSLLKQKII